MMVRKSTRRLISYLSGLGLLTMMASLFSILRGFPAIVDRRKFASEIFANPPETLLLASTALGSMHRYDPSVKHCELSVLIMDPRIPYLPSSDMFYTAALESLGEYAPNRTCFILQVSSCVMQQHLLPQGQPTETKNNTATRHNVPPPDQWNEIPLLNSSTATNIDQSLVRTAIIENVH